MFLSLHLHGRGNGVSMLMQICWFQYSRNVVNCDLILELYLTTGHDLLSVSRQHLYFIINLSA